MLNSIKKYFKKAKAEVSREYAIGSPIPARADATDGLDASPRELPRIWTGVDLDGTLAHYSPTAAYGKVGEPVPAMLALVKKMINNGIRVKIFTARVEDPDQMPIIRKWLRDNGLPDLEITNIKDYGMHRLYDDRCIQVERNTGRLIVDD